MYFINNVLFFNIFINITHIIRAVSKSFRYKSLKYIHFYFLVY